MKCNVGNADRMVRYVIGICIILLGFYFQSWWGAVGLVFILTGTIRWCPAYIPFGFSSCESDKK